MRKVILSLAVSLDGYIEGPNGEYDWCFMDPEFGIEDFIKRIDALFIGRRTYEMMLNTPEVPGFPKMKLYIFSTTLSEVKKDVILIKDHIKERILEIKNEPSKDIWLFGGAGLTSSLLQLGMIDKLILAVHPILLGGGKLLFPSLKNRIGLTLKNCKSFSSGLVALEYEVVNRQS